MTTHLVELALGFSIGVNLVLAFEVAKLRMAVRDATRRVRYLGRVLSSHASGNGHHAVESSEIHE